MANDSTKDLVKVIIWTTGRSVSNALLKCLTYVPDSVIWHEPWYHLIKYSHVFQHQFPFQYQSCKKSIEENGGVSEVAKIKNGYDASDKDFDWLKQQLEADYRGKRLLVVKAVHYGPSVFNYIPSGFRHVFLIRHPKKVITSFFKADLTSFSKSIANITEIHSAYEDRFQHCKQYKAFKQMNELWKVVKETGLDPHPLIIDAHDLLENPKEVLEGLSGGIGIPFTEDLLTWPAGAEYLKKWISSKQHSLVYKSWGFRAVAEGSTCFQKPSGSSSNGSDLIDEVLKKYLPEIEDMVDVEIQYYDEMYNNRSSELGIYYIYKIDESAVDRWIVLVDSNKYY